MLKKTSRLWTPLACGLLLAGLAWAPAIADDDVVKKKIRIQKVVCEGDDCDETVELEGHHKMMFIGEDGTATELEGAPHMKWIHGDGHGNFHFSGMHGGGPFLGVQLTDLTPELRSHFGVPDDAGVLVAKVVDDSAAAKAGIQVGDVIASVDGRNVSSGRALGKMIRSQESGATVVLDVWRNGGLEKVSATLDEQEGGRHRIAKRIQVDCDDEEGDCNVFVGDGFDCGGAEECEVKVECGDDGCTCIVNGEAADCGDMPGLPAHGG